MNIGETVGNFEIISQLGKGGMGAVYLAQQKNIKTKVAIKVLEGGISTNTTHVQRFFNEAVAVSQIHHSGIVRIFDVGFHTSGEAYLVMEYLEGETLTKRIKSRTRLGIGAVADFGRQIASVLEATHSANITHRDLKPDNILLVQDSELVNGERIKVLDFGIAKLTAPGGPTGKPRMTAMGASSIGTPNYMSPEQWHSLAEADWRTDAYALGCVAFEMACGRPPFIGESMADICAQHLSEQPPIPSKLVPGLPPQLDRLIGRLLEKDPADRPTMRETMQTFTELGHSEGIALSTLPPKTGMLSPYATQARAESQPPAMPMPVAPAAAMPMQQPSASMTAPMRSKKPRRIGLFVVLAVVVIAGSVGAAVVISRNSATSEQPAGGAASGSSIAATPPPLQQAAPVAPVAPVVDAAVAPVAADAAIADRDPEPEPVQVESLTASKSNTVVRFLPIDVTITVCIDAEGYVTDVGPKATPPNIVAIVKAWRFDPHIVKGLGLNKAVPACASVVLPKDPANSTQRTTTGDAAPKATPPKLTPTEPPKPHLTVKESRLIEQAVRAEAKVCTKGGSGAITVRLDVAGDGRISLVDTKIDGGGGAKLDCVKDAIKRVKLPKLDGAGATSVRISLRPPPTNRPIEQDQDDDGGFEY